MLMPEKVPIRIQEMREENGIKGYETFTNKINPVNIIYWKLRNSSEYFFEAWEAGIGKFVVYPDKLITSQRKASKFAESKLREMIRAQF